MNGTQIADSPSAPTLEQLMCAYCRLSDEYYRAEIVDSLDWQIH